MKAFLTCTICALSLITRVFGATNSSSSSNSTDSSTLTAYLADGYRKFIPRNTRKKADSDITVDLGIASDAYAKAVAFIAPLNNTEKISIVIASSFTNDNASWSAYTNTDGVSGLNFYYYVSAFPMANALLQTWNRDLIAAQFAAVGEEYFDTGNNMVNGAVISPLGRVPEGSYLCLSCQGE